MPIVDSEQASAGWPYYYLNLDFFFFKLSLIIDCFYNIVGNMVDDTSRSTIKLNHNGTIMKMVSIVTSYCELCIF